MDPIAWHDDPKTELTEDAFDRKDYAHRTARLIVRAHSPESSTVFGLVGPWGSGKSTLTNFVCEAIDEFTSGQDEAAAWKIVSFTPWATSDSASMLGEFFAALSAAFPEVGGSRLRTTLGRLASISTPATSMIPLVGAGVTKGAEMLAEHLSRQRPWQEVFESASEQLRQQGTPVLIVVDDVDRLQGQELLTLLKVIRLLGRFPGIQYLLAYDDVTLFRALDQEIDSRGIGGTGQDFMEKIVQFPIPVPALTATQMLRRLNSGIDRAAGESGRTISSTRRVSDLLDVFGAALDTPRAIDRYTSQLHHQFAMLAPDEVDDEDVLILALVRCAFPTIYAALPSWRKRLLSGGNGEMDWIGGSLKEQAVDLEPIFNGMPPPEVAYARRALHALFPRLENQSSYNGDPASRRVSVDSYFDRYFSLTITSDDVSDREVTRAVRAACDGDPSELLAFILDPRKERAFLATDKATRIDLSAEPWPRRAVLVRTLLATVQSMSRESVGLFTTPRDRGLSWIARILSTAPEDNAADVRALLTASPDLALQLEVWRDMRRLMPAHRTDELPQWAVDHTSHLASRAFSAVLDNLRAGDEAPLDDHAGWFLHFAVSLGDVEEYRHQIDADLRDDTFTVEDLASRTVSVGYASGVQNPRGEITGIDAGEFRALAPNADGSWFDLPIEADVDLHDLTWPNRRRYARGRLPRPEAGAVAD